MDYSKAKNILIAIMLAANLMLAAAYADKISQRDTDSRALAETTQRYIEELGGSVDTQIPLNTESLPVLYVTILRSGEQAFYGKYPVEISGVKEGMTAKISKEGDSKNRVIPAAKALQILVSGAERSNIKGKSISDIALVYHIDRSSMPASEGSDTAFPAWKITLSNQVFYIEAYEN